jgi:hypothetical protein
VAKKSAGIDTAAVVLARLESGGLESLAKVVVDHLLACPIDELLDPHWAARQVVLTLESVSAGPHTADWLRRRIAEVRKQVPEGTVRTRIPAEVVTPLRDVVGRTYRPDRALVGRLLDHEAMRRLLKDVLVGALEGFVRKIRLPAAGASATKLNKLKALGERALHDSVLGGLSQELERQAQARIRDFVEDAVHSVVEQVADHVASAEHAQRYGLFRVHVVDALLDTELEVFARELDKLQPDDLVATGAAGARALAHRAGFQTEVEGVLRAAMTAAGGRSLGAILTEAGIDAGWRSEVEAQLVARGRALLETAPFRAWLTTILAGT